MNAEKQSNSSLIRTRMLCAALALMCISFWAIAPVKAQTPSTDRDNPTPLTTNSITGVGVNQKTEYFYSFAATPGDVKIALAVTALKQAAVSSVDISVFDADANALMSAYANPDQGSSLHTIRTINIKSPQTLLLQVTVSPGVSTFKIALDGSISLPSSAGSDATDSSAPPAATNNSSSGGGNTNNGKLNDPSKPPTTQVIEGTGVNQKTQRIFEFSAGPGDVRLQLNVQSLPNAAVSSVDIELLDQSKTEIAAGFANPSLGESKQTIVKAHLQQKQNLTLKVIISPGVNNYTLTVSGVVNGYLHQPGKYARTNQIYQDNSTEPFNRRQMFGD